MDHMCTYSNVSFKVGVIMWLLLSEVKNEAQLFMGKNLHRVSLTDHILM